MFSLCIHVCVCVCTARQNILQFLLMIAIDDDFHFISIRFVSIFFLNNFIAGYCWLVGWLVGCCFCAKVLTKELNRKWGKKLFSIFIMIIEKERKRNLNNNK